LIQTNIPSIIRKEMSANKEQGAPPSPTSSPPVGHRAPPPLTSVTDELMIHSQLETIRHRVQYAGTGQGTTLKALDAMCAFVRFITETKTDCFIDWTYTRMGIASRMIKLLLEGVPAIESYRQAVRDRTNQERDGPEDGLDKAMIGYQEARVIMVNQICNRLFKWSRLPTSVPNTKMLIGPPSPPGNCPDNNGSPHSPPSTSSEEDDSAWDIGGRCITLEDYDL